MLHQNAQERANSPPFDEARALFQAGELAAALHHFHRSMLQQPRPEAALHIAECYLGLCDPTAAVNLASQLHPRDLPSQRLDALSRAIRAALSGERAMAVQVNGAIAFLPGAAFGQGQSVLRVPVQVSPPSQWEPDQIAALLGQRLNCESPSAGSDAKGLVKLVLWNAVTAQREARHSVFANGTVRKLTEADTFELIVPYAHRDGGILAVRWALGTLDTALHSVSGGAPETIASPEAIAATDRFIALLNQHAPQTRNMLNLLREANDQGVPWAPIGDHRYQLGQGVRRRWIDSSLTDATPGLGVRLAGHKLRAAELLRRLGLPFPDQLPVADAEGARRAADFLGYPVVVKPADAEGGHGVSSGLTTADTVTAAWEEARLHSDEVLVEAHVPGRDYRLSVLDGRVVHAVERKPGGIVGNGESNVRDLLTNLNSAPLRHSRHAPLNPVTLDDEALALLSEAGLEPDSVPEAGRFLRLRRSANIARGGTPVDVTASVHPDNARLAERAAQLLGLDIAGIDLLISDIGQPWHEAGGVICEINAQPTFGLLTAARVYTRMVESLMGGGEGRIHIVVVVGMPEAAARIHEALVASGVIAGLATAPEARISNEVVAHGDWRGFRGARLLLMDPDVELAVIDQPADALERDGLYPDHCTVLAVGETDPAAADAVLTSLPAHAAQVVALSNAVPGLQPAALTAGVPLTRVYDTEGHGAAQALAEASIAALDSSTTTES